MYLVAICTLWQSAELRFPPFFQSSLRCLLCLTTFLLYLHIDSFVDFLQIIDHCFLFVKYADKSLKGKPRAGFLHTQLSKLQHTYYTVNIVFGSSNIKKDLFPKSLKNKFGSRAPSRNNFQNFHTSFYTFNFEKVFKFKRPPILSNLTLSYKLPQLSTKNTKMSAIRSSFIRAAAKAGRRTTPSIISRQAVRAFTTTPQANDYEAIHEKEIPATKFQPGSGAERVTIPVEEAAAAAAAAKEAVDVVTPLTQSAYKGMTPTMQKMSLMGKVVVVTGGARGLGNHMARACVEAGAKALVIFDANQELGDASAAELYELTGNKIPISFFKVDVRDADAIESAVASVVAEHGAPDVLINSAGIADSNIPAETYDHNMFRRLIDINLTGSFLMSQSVGKAMMAAGKPGSIVLVASMSGSVVNYPQEQSCYNASKAGVVQLGKSLGAEWAKYNVRVNMISPGYMDTALNNVPALDAQKVIWKSLTPQNRLGAVDDLNGLAVFLASDASAFMTGSNVIIDGGYTLY
ncbi:putative d-arabinitol 2-dehydrogenase protein [Botrytis cinerea BcDW1]|nr:putative d-arabinitol 2-dehydrogenase protein [Botrytis cinerea BcDW1]